MYKKALTTIKYQ